MNIAELNKKETGVVSGAVKHNRLPKSYIWNAATGIVNIGVNLINYLTKPIINIGRCSGDPADEFDLNTDLEPDTSNNYKKNSVG